MLVVKILAGLAIFLSLIALVVWFVAWFNEHCQKKFGYSFFSLQAFVTILVAVGCLWGGNEWYRSSLSNGGDTLNGIVIMLIGGIAAAGLTFWNFRRTNLLYGLGGTAVQFWLFGGLALIALPLLIFGVIGSAAGGAERATAKRVYVVNR